MLWILNLEARFGITGFWNRVGHRVLPREAPQPGRGRTQGGTTMVDSGTNGDAMIKASVTSVGRSTELCVLDPQPGCTLWDYRGLEPVEPSRDATGGSSTRSGVAFFPCHKKYVSRAGYARFFEKKHQTLNPTPFSSDFIGAPPG